MVNNQQVFEYSVTLIAEYLEEKGFADISSAILTRLPSIPVESPDEDYYPNAADITQLEHGPSMVGGTGILATTVLTECAQFHEAQGTAERGRSNSTSTRRRRARNIFKPIRLRQVDDEWESDYDLGYQMIPVSEEELQAYEETAYEAMTLRHESYEPAAFIPSLTDLDEDTQAAVLEKIQQLKNFPDELSQLTQAIGLAPEDLIEEGALEEALVEHFLTELGVPTPVVPEEEEVVEEYDTYFLKIIQVRGRTGFQESKDFPIVVGNIIAGRYQIEEYLGSAAFSTAIRCYDYVTNKSVCLKIITNNKDFVDQSLDEIRLLTLVKNACQDNLDEHHLLRIHDYFYHKEHLFIVTELLRDNLYEFYQYNLTSGDEVYFTVERLKIVAKQILVALKFIHNLGMIHCDLKPENILVKSYSRCEVKVIDLGSSCFIKDHLSSYVQSRSYRAPEVILGLPYGQKIDIWSVGCILAELYTGQVLFLNDTLATLLARVESIIGPIPSYMRDEGAYSWRYYNDYGKLFDRRATGAVLLEPKATSLQHRLRCDDPQFLDFMTRLLAIDPAERPTASEALLHPWFA